VRKIKKCRDYTHKGASYTEQQEGVGTASSEKVSEGNIEEKTKVTRRGGKRSKQLLAHIKKWSMYRNLKENVDLRTLSLSL
jgi:hypothetical protein